MITSARTTTRLSGDLDASLQVSNLKSIHFHKLTDNNGGGFSAGAVPFFCWAEPAKPC